MRTRVGEINIICTDLDSSLAFYRDVLGFRAIEPEGPALHLACGETRFLLLAVAERPREVLPYCQSPEISLDLLVDDLPAMKSRCESAGVTFVDGFQPTAERFFIRDPDGLVIEIIQDSAPRRS